MLSLDPRPTEHGTSSVLKCGFTNENPVSAKHGHRFGVRPEEGPPHPYPSPSSYRAVSDVGRVRDFSRLLRLRRPATTAADRRGRFLPLPFTTHPWLRVRPPVGSVSYFAVDTSTARANDTVFISFRPFPLATACASPCCRRRCFLFSCTVIFHAKLDLRQRRER